MTAERIEEALPLIRACLAHSLEATSAFEALLIHHAAALREAQAENEQLREALAEIVSVSLPDQIQERLALAALAPADEAKR